MKYVPAEEIPGVGTLPVLELSRRNLEVLLAKLDDPASLRTLADPDDKIAVRAVFLDEGEMIAVRAVENDQHYKTRPPGEMYMPTSGKFI